MKPLVLILAAGVAFYAYRRLSRPKCPRQIVALGDSITAGNYITYLGDLLPRCTVGYFGFVGKGAGDISKETPRALDSKPDDVIVLAGVNDLASGRSLNSIQDNLSRIYNQVHKAGGRVVAVEVLPWLGYAGSKGHEDRTKTLNQWIRSESSADVVVDASRMGQNGAMSDDLTGDGLHPNSDGKRRLAEIIYQDVY